MFFDDLPKIKKGKSLIFKREDLTILDYKKPERKMATSSWPMGDEVIFDVECYPGFFGCGVKHIASQTYLWLTNPKHMIYILWGYKAISFNGMSYDIPMIEAAHKDASFEQLKALSDDIILNDKRIPIRGKYNHIDTIEVAPLSESLKTYAGRLHAKRMQDLPFEPTEKLEPEQQDIVVDYCFNDLDNTELLYNELRPFIELRENLGKKYNQDLRSKSDAQIAEAVICSEIEKITGYPVKSPNYGEGYTFRYTKPDWLSFDTPILQQALDTILAANFTLDKAGRPQLPESVAKLKIRIGESIYRMGIGGLHSSEKSIAHRETDCEKIVSYDVASYYPATIINLSLSPAHMGKNFLDFYKQTRDSRLRVKRRISEIEELLANGQHLP